MRYVKFSPRQKEINISAETRRIPKLVFSSSEDGLNMSTRYPEVSLYSHFHDVRWIREYHPLCGWNHK